MGIELKSKSGNITLTVPKFTSGGAVDLSNYYTKAETDEQISNAIDNIDIPETDLTGYATVDYVDNAVDNIEIPDTSLFVTAQYVQTAINESTPDLTPYAKKEDIPDVSDFISEIPSEYITEDELAAKDYATVAQIPDVSAFQTEAQVNTLISNALAEIGIAEKEAY